MFAKAAWELYVFTLCPSLLASHIRMVHLVHEMNQFWHISNQNSYFIEDFLSFHQVFFLCSSILSRISLIFSHFISSSTPWLWQVLRIFLILSFFFLNICLQFIYF